MEMSMVNKTVKCVSIVYCVGNAEEQNLSDTAATTQKERVSSDQMVEDRESESSHASKSLTKSAAQGHDCIIAQANPRTRQVSSKNA